MQYIHRIVNNFNSQMQSELATLGFEVNQGVDAFEIDEADERWPLINLLAKKWQALDSLVTTFTNSEINDAKLVTVQPAWHHQYPEPSDRFGRWDLSFDVSAYCDVCGIGKMQKTPLRIKSEPKWGRRHILQLNWLFDEFFVTPMAWDEVFRPFGIQCTPVVQHRSGKELNSIVQLKIDVRSHCTVQTDNRSESHACHQCGRLKYSVISRGMFPSIVGDVVNTPLFKTVEYFGSATSAWQQVVASAELYQAIKKHALRGARFEPIENEL